MSTFSASFIGMQITMDAQGRTIIRRNVRDGVQIRGDPSTRPVLKLRIIYCPPFSSRRDQTGSIRWVGRRSDVVGR